MAEENKKKVEGSFLEYKGKPLVREGNTICYGDMSEKYFLLLEIMSYKTENGVNLPDNIIVQIIDSKDSSKIMKQGAKRGLHDAFSIGVIWLEMALKQG